MTIGKKTGAQRLRRAPPRGAGTPTIYEALKREILEMRRAPGDPLDETQLSLCFGMSRTPVREALLRLVAEGLATTLPNRNTVVSTLDFAALPDYLDALMLMYRISTRLAAERRGAEDLVLIRARQQKFAAAVQAADALAMIETNRDFHVAIAKAGGNRYYTALFERLLNEGMRLLRLYYRTFDDHLPAEYVGEHEAIIEAIAARDPEEADRLGRAHGLQIAGQLQRFLSPRLGQSLLIHERFPAKWDAVGG